MDIAEAYPFSITKQFNGMLQVNFIPLAKIIIFDVKDVPLEDRGFILSWYSVVFIKLSYNKYWVVFCPTTLSIIKQSFEVPK